MGTFRIVHVSKLNLLAVILLTSMPLVFRSACISTCGWWLGLASVCNFVAAMVLAILKLCVEEYISYPWHQWTCYVVILWLAVLINIFGMRFLPALNQYLRKWNKYRDLKFLLTIHQVYFSISTLLITVVSILVCAAPNYQSSAWVFADTTNLNQSYDKWFLFILCLLNNTYGFMGTDAGAHLAEEIPSPSVNAPKVIVSFPFSICHHLSIITNSQRYIQ